MSSCSQYSYNVFLLFINITVEPRHGTEKIVRYSGVFVIAKTPLSG